MSQHPVREKTKAMRHVFLASGTLEISITLPTHTQGGQGARLISQPGRPPCWRPMMPPQQHSQSGWDENRWGKVSGTSRRHRRSRQEVLEDNPAMVAHNPPAPSRGPIRAECLVQSATVVFWGRSHPLRAAGVFACPPTLAGLVVVGAREAADPELHARPTLHLPAGS